MGIVQSCEDDHGDFWMASTGNQSEQDLEARHVGEIKFKNDTIDCLAIADGETSSTCDCLNHHRIGRGSSQSFSIIVAILVIIVDEKNSV